jgi:phage terminase large subunit-like protein
MIDGAYYDPSALKLLEALASTVKLTKSTPSGRPEEFHLLPHARKFFANLLGWKRADGTRMYRKAYWSMARKQAKTQYIALLGLCMLILDQEANPEIYAAATEVEQAGQCYEAARDMVRSNPDLDEVLVITDYRKTISYPANGGTFQALSSKGKTKHGSNPSAVIFDELHVWGAEHQELYDALTTGSGARRQPLRVAITTAGTDELSICGQEYAYAKRVLSGQVHDPTYLADIHELPKDADWTDESLWHLSMPAIDHFPGMRQQMREERDAALNSPAKQNSWRRLYGNQWTNAADQWIPMHVWDRTAETITDAELEGLPCFGGLDLAAVSDLTAFVLWFQIGDRFIVRPYFFIPEEDLASRSRRDGVRYDQWVKDGFIETTPGNVTDWVFVTDRITQLAKKFQIRQVAFDRYGARDVATRLMDAGIEVLDWGQGFLDMSPACKRIEQLALQGRIVHGGHPVLRWNIDCCSITQDAAQNIKPVKPTRHKSTKRIDGVVAMVMAAGAHMRAEPDGGSVYDNPETAVM